MVDVRLRERQPPGVPVASHPAPPKIRGSAPLVGLTFLILNLLSCDQIAKSEAGQKSKSPSTSPATDSAVPEKNAIAHIPVGTFLAGSLPGEPGRDPSVEPAQWQLELGPFRIDAYPYPGDPKEAPRLGVTQTEASALCAAKGGRLCTELEWERACRGSDSANYPTGPKPCPPDNKFCVGGFDVAMMGTLPEWTASHFGKASDHAGDPVSRGADSQVPAQERRCARRTSPAPEELTGFRCCYGAPNAASLQEPELGTPYKEVDVTKKELEALLSANERTAHLAKDAQLFKPETTRTVLARGPGDTMGFTLTAQGLEWQPDRGSKFLVVAGKSDNTSFVLAYYLSDKKKTLAGSFIMDNESGPISLAYADSIRQRIHFSGCWGCPGETGKILFRKPEELVLLQP